MPFRDLFVARLPERRFRGLAAGVREAWLLGESGTVYHVNCRLRPTCELAPLAYPVRISALAQLGGGFVAVGVRGSIMRFSADTGQPLRLPAGAEQEDLAGVAVRPDSSFVVLGQDRLFNFDAAGRGRVLAPLPPYVRGAGFVTATLTGGAVVATDRGDMALVDSLGRTTRYGIPFWDFRTPFRVTSMAIVDSQRVALSLAQDDDDPYGNGGVFLVSLSRQEGSGLPLGDDPRARARTRFYYVRVTGDTTGVWDGVRGPWLTAFGDAGLSARWPLARLPR